MIDLTQFDPLKDDYLANMYFETEDGVFPYDDEHCYEREEFEDEEIMEALQKKVNDIDVYMSGLRVLLSVIVPINMKEIVVAQENIYNLGQEFYLLMYDVLDRANPEESDDEYVMECIEKNYDKSVTQVVKKYFPECTCDAHRINEDTLDIAAQIVNYFIKKDNLAVVYTNESIKVVNQFN